MAALRFLLATLLVLAVGVSCEELGRFLSGRAVLLDQHFAPIPIPSAHNFRPRREADSAHILRPRRDTGYGHAPAHAPAHGYKSKGKVGPVYTFVKTDYNGNFKWGVRHRAGAQYGGHH
ncbi:uncharacterized protein LOC122245605 [Penaeus japonicus]|uniref:uncharacterized protein LOC122245605 n=1 Tax=Penaeus japonicus TaxID=27405 RepID=UPI001C716019|nr:uncharacterized protein LOC122245605 [Penaeus japonicus]